jgi:hypothetical protein
MSDGHEDPQPQPGNTRGRTGHPIKKHQAAEHAPVCVGLGRVSRDRVDLNANGVFTNGPPGGGGATAFGEMDRGWCTRAGCGARALPRRSTLLGLRDDVAHVAPGGCAPA